MNNNEYFNIVSKFFMIRYFVIFVLEFNYGIIKVKYIGLENVD